MKGDQTKLSRRVALKGLAIVGGMAALPTLTISREALAADDKVPKAAMKYQDHPHEGEQCSGCMHYVPPKQGEKMGECTLVAGDISPRGWCMAYAPIKD